MKNLIVTVIGGGQGYTLTDADLWGLECSIRHSIDDGYLRDNLAWAEGMLERLGKLREEVRRHDGQQGG